MDFVSNILVESPREVDDPIDVKESLGLKTPKVKPKLDDTIPSLLNLYSDMSSSKNTYKNDSFKIDKLRLKNNAIPSLFNKPNNFIKGHLKAFSNENFSFPKFFNFLGTNQEDEKLNEEDEENDNFNYNFKNELNLEGGYFDFGGDDNNDDENEDFKKNIFIDNYEKINKKEDEDENEEYLILNFLKKKKNKN